MNEQDTDRTFIWLSIMLIVGLFYEKYNAIKHWTEMQAYSLRLCTEIGRGGALSILPQLSQYMEIMSRQIPGESQRGFSFQKTVGIWKMSECLSRSEINWIPEMLRRARSYNTVNRYSLTIFTVCHQRTKRWHDLKRDKNMTYALIYLIYFCFLALKKKFSRKNNFCMSLSEKITCCEWVSHYDRKTQGYRSNIVIADCPQGPCF